MELLPEGVKVLHLEDTFRYDFNMIPCVTYASRTGEDQHLHILQPRDRKDPDAKFPLVVFV